MQDLTETLGERLGSFANDLSGEDVAHGVLDHGGLLVAVVALELRVVLEAETNGHLVRTGRGDQVVESAKVYRRQFVDDNGRL